MVLTYLPNLSYMPILMRQFTHETLIDLLVRILDAAAARADDSDVSAAVTDFVNELLVGATQLHIFLAVFGQLVSWVFAGKLGNLVEIEKALPLLLLGLLRAVLTPVGLHCGFG